MQKLPINPFLDFYSTPDAMIINPFVFGGGAFDPLSLSPALWLSDTGSDASTWPDLSGNGRNATQATAGSRPEIVAGAQNGRQVRRFDGVDDILSMSAISGFSSYTIFTVSKFTTLNAVNVVFANGDIASNGVGIYASTTLLRILHGGLVDASSGAASLAAEVITVVYSPSLLNSWRNGTPSLASQSTAYNTPTTNLSIGGSGYASQYFTGDIAEILVFPTALSTTDRQNVENYLNAKYNIY